MTYGYVETSLETAEDRWQLLAELMGKSVQDLTAASAGGLGSSVQSAATAFLESWRSRAGESRDIATGMAGAVRATLADSGEVDEATKQVFDQLDTRLGPAR